MVSPPEKPHWNPWKGLTTSSQMGMCQGDASSFSWSKSYEQCCSKLKWLSLNKRRDLSICCQIYKIVNHLVHNFSKYLALNVANTHYYLFLQCRQSRINCFRYSVFVQAPFIWNSFPSDIVNSNSYSSFKFKLYSYLNRTHFHSAEHCIRYC